MQACAARVWRTHLDREDGVGRGVAHVARAHDVDGEPERDAVRRGDDGVRAALDGSDGVLERADVLAQLEGAPGRLRAGAVERAEGVHWRGRAVTPKFRYEERGYVRSMPAEKPFGRAEARTTARTDGSRAMLSKVRPKSVQSLR